MACKRSEQCEHADICQYAKSNAYDILGGSCYRPKEPQTNEEWFCTLSTEEKAKEIYKIAKDDFKELRKLFNGVANDDCDAVALWLKQPYTIKE